jgi:hypothetical protein
MAHVDAATLPWRLACVATNLKDRSRIDVNEATERAYWCQKFGCSETQLRNAVKMVGVTASKVRAQLARLK